MLLRWLGTQPPWSNLPFVVLMMPRSDSAEGPWAPEWFDTIGNAVLLERPLGAAELASAVGAALRDRKKQYVARDYLMEREQAAAHLAALNTSLETRIAERTDALRTAYDHLAEEVRERERTQTLLMHAQRMEALGQLAGGIAHDFNNILQAVEGSIALIERRPDDGVSARRLARLALKAVERGATITRRLLAFGRRGDLRTETLDAVDLLSGLREILTHSLGANIEVNVRLDPNLVALRADKGQLETVLVNLGINARDAMPQGGQLSFLAATEVVSSGGSAHSHGVAPGCYVRLTVGDTGLGMDAGHARPRMRPLFHDQATRPGDRAWSCHGRGLRLAVRRDAGRSSTPGKGTTVTLWLPAADFDGATAGATAQCADAASAPEATTKTARMLVVDDEDVVRETLAESLEFEGFGVLTAANGTEALSLLAAGEAVDAIVTDLSMPGMDGLALIRAAQECRPGLPAVLLTGYAGDDTALAVNGAISGTFSLLRKPTRFRDLVDTIQSLLAAGTVRIR